MSHINELLQNISECLSLELISNLTLFEDLIYLRLMEIIAGPTAIDICEEIARITNWELIIPEYKTFSDGESYLKLPKTIFSDVIIIQSLYYPQDTNLFQLFNLISTIKHFKPNSITVYTPYFCYSRSDRDILGGEAISSRTIIEILEKIGVDHLITLDIHNPEIFNFAKSMKTTNIYPSKSFAEYLLNERTIDKNYVVIAPDKGARNRARSLAEALGINYYQLVKFRDPKTGEVNVNFGKENIIADKAIVVDDIVSTGSSLVQTASLLSTQNITVTHFVITHLLNTEALDRITGFGNGIIITTNSIPNIVRQISSGPDLLEVF